MLQRQTPPQPLEFRDMRGILAVGVLWTFKRRRRVPQESGLPIGQDRGGKLMLAAQLRTALGSRQELEDDLGFARGGQLTTVWHITPPPWTYCTAVSKWSNFGGSLQCTNREVKHTAIVPQVAR
jgi:hypothetical protein